MKTGFENLNHQAQARLKNMAAPNGWQTTRHGFPGVECAFCRERSETRLWYHWCEPLEVALKNEVTNGVIGHKVPGIMTPEQFEAFDLATLAAIIDAHLNGEFDE